jgi:hypothetical protein
MTSKTYRKLNHVNLGDAVVLATGVNYWFHIHQLGRVVCFFLAYAFGEWAVDFLWSQVVYRWERRRERKIYERYERYPIVW